MILSGILEICEKLIFPIPSNRKFFNQYSDQDLRIDLPKAAEIRKENLINYIISYADFPEFLLLGEAPGPWGCRFSGVPFTSEKQLINNFLPFTGKRSSRKYPEITTKKLPPYHSDSSDRFWEVTLPFYPRFFAWNIVPFHPHKPEAILSIDKPNSSEVEGFALIIKEIIKFLKPKKTIAIGRVPENGLIKIGLNDVIYVRHPARGGSEKFREGLKRIFRES